MALRNPLEQRGHKLANVCFDVQVALVFRDVELKLRKNGKVLIDKVTGKATAGRVLALMGPSGNRRSMENSSLHLFRVMEDSSLRLVPYGQRLGLYWLTLRIAKLGLGFALTLELSAVQP